MRTSIPLDALLLRLVPLPRDVTMECYRSPVDDSWHVTLWKGIGRELGWVASRSWRKQSFNVEAAELRKLALFGEERAVLDMLSDRLRIALYLLNPPRIPFRIGTRHPKRLQFARPA